MFSSGLVCVQVCIVDIVGPQNKGHYGPTILSIVERFSVCQRSNNACGVVSVVCREVDLISDGSLSEVPLYTTTEFCREFSLSQTSNNVSKCPLSLSRMVPYRRFHCTLIVLLINMSTVGVTIDYGFLDRYDHGHICNGWGAWLIMEPPNKGHYGQTILSLVQSFPYLEGQIMLAWG